MSATDPRPLIAFVGNADKCHDEATGRQACAELGAELARRGCRLMVFSSERAYVEWDAVKGYLSTGANLPAASIVVRYPPNLEGEFEDENPGDLRFDRQRQPGDWEASMYPAFGAFDGLLLVGGGDTTRICGLFALGSKHPLVTLGGLGGAASTVWDYMKADSQALATPAESSLMAARTWHADSARGLIDALLSQRERQLDAERAVQERAAETHRGQILTRLAVIGFALFVASLAAVVEVSTSEAVPRSLLWLLFGTPAVAGASAAAIRALFDQLSASAAPSEPRSLTTTLALGFWTAGAAALIYLLPQLTAVGTLDRAALFKLFAFSIPTALVAGLTVDQVLRNLIKTELPAVKLPGSAASGGKSVDVRRRGKT